jgi:hypothetical protein
MAQKGRFASDDYDDNLISRNIFSGLFYDEVSM